MAGNLFYGIHLNNASLTAKLLSVVAEHSPRVPRALWTSEEKLHITLLFIGGVPEEEPAERLAKACRGRTPFALKVHGAGCFGSRVLFANLSPVWELQALNKALGGKGAFNPHLTLAKLEKSGDSAIEFHSIAESLNKPDQPEYGRALVESVKLYRTVGGGKPYEVVAEHRLVT